MFASDRAAGRIEGRWLPPSAAQLLWEQIVRDDPAASALVSPGGVARAACQSWRRLNDYQVSLESIAADESPESVAFARWCDRYSRLLDEHGWVDVAVAASRVHAASAAPGIQILGFDRLTPLQEASLSRWAEQGIEVRRDAAVTVAGVARRVTCVDSAAELDAAARWAAADLQAGPDRRIAIVVPDLARRRAEVRRIVERVLVPESGLSDGPAPESRAFDLAAARPLAAQPVVSAAFDLLDLFARPPDASDVSRLLRNPFVTAAVEESDARARLDARIRRFESPGLSLRRLRSIAGERGCMALARILAEGQSSVSKWPEKDIPSNWIKRFLVLLESLGWPGGNLASAEHQAEQRFRSLVAELGACDEFTGRVSANVALGQLREMAGRVLFEPQELRAPLLLIDPETCAGMHFDGLWICGLDASSWPPAASPDPFLPRSAQLRCGLPGASAESAAAEARRLFERLLASAPEVILSVPATDHDAPVLPSPWLDGIERLETAPHWPVPGLGRALFEQRPSLDVLPDVALPTIDPEEAARGGARLLELQSACPFRAQAELRLGARALDEPGLGLDASERGDLVHAALAEFWRELRDHAGLCALDEAALRTAVRRSVSRALAGAVQSADGVMRHLLDLEAGWLEARVLEMVAADRARAPFEVAAIEQPCRGRIGDLTLEMRPDRIDRLADGTLAVIDYKTGADADVGSWLGERPRLPQLPAYVRALGPERVSAVAFARVRSGSTGYVGVARDAVAFPGLKVPGARGGLRGFDAWPGLLAEWERRLDALASEFAAGEARLAPDPPHACQYCHLGALCRIAETSTSASSEDGAGD